MPDVFASATLETAQANALASVKVQVQNLNNSLTAQYMTTFNNWSISVIAGRAPNTDPPKPPNGYVVGYFDDPTSGPGSLSPYGEKIVQWPYPAIGEAPVCPMPPIPEVPLHATAGGWKIGIAIPGTGGVWFQALEGDTTPNNATGPGTSLDGVSGLFQKYGSALGSGWFRKIG